MATGKAVDMAMLEDLNEWRSEFRTDFLTKVVRRLHRSWAIVRCQ